MDAVWLCDTPRRNMQNLSQSPQLNESMKARPLQLMPADDWALTGDFSRGSCDQGSL